MHKRIVKACQKKVKSFQKEINSLELELSNIQSEEDRHFVEYFISFYKSKIDICNKKAA